jgi:hypothetical protein
MATEEPVAAPCARVYRHLHGSPMLAGVPAHVVLILLGVGCLGGFGVMSLSKPAGFTVLGVVIAAWVVIAFACSQDRVAVPLAALRLAKRFPPVISSFTRGYPRVVLEDEEESR